MEQQNNKNQPIGKENLSKEAALLSHEEVEYFKSVPTNLHIVLNVIKNGVVIDKQDTTFILEDEADMFSRTLATTVSGLPLDFWSVSTSDIAVCYSLTDPDNTTIKYMITVYPKKL
ncbi:hypothetical protein [Aeromonas phage 4L372D]|uniref:Uncharacterized protein n=1 Tax=Aeromonas phage 4L372D TaxID=2588518 RepID=A0A5B9N9C6_9CAUD|nr:hypothetical protein HWC27_gp235 [Aeromonas phage 4L372D]QEG08620.1 hypothetical protein [Aeromonas phage 4L372D]